MDVVTFGETMVLLYPTSDGPMRFAQQFEKSIAGAESNVCIALSRLGHQAGWISRLGRDEFGLFVRNTIRGEGIDTSNVIFDEAEPTGVMFKEKRTGQDPQVFYYRRGSAASRLSPNDLDPSYLSRAKYLHLTGITPALSESCKETVFHAIDIAKDNGLTVVFDPNIRFKLWSREEAKRTLLDIAAKADIIMPGLDEGEFLTGETTPEAVAKAFKKRGASAVVIKLGAKGAYYAAEDEERYVEGFPVEHIVDTVGAGDGFAAGFLSGLLRNYAMKDAVRLANRIGAYALTVPGDVEGYPYWEQVDEENQANRVLR